MPYFHVVFTLPEDLSPLALHNKKAVCDVLFRAASETLLTIAADPKHMGARIGFFALMSPGDVGDESGDEVQGIPERAEIGLVARVDPIGPIEEGGSRRYRMGNLDADEIATEPFENEFRVATPTGFSSLIPRRVLAFTGAEWRDDAKRHTARVDFLRYPAMRDLAACRYLVSRLEGAGAGAPGLGMEPLGSDD